MSWFTYSPAELEAIASAGDQPYITKLDVTSSRDTRVIYLLTPNMEEKEKWDSTLEATVQNGSMPDAYRNENVCRHQYM